MVKSEMHQQTPQIKSTDDKKSLSSTLKREAEPNQSQKHQLFAP